MFAHLFKHMNRILIIITLAALVTASCGNRKKKKPITVTMFYNEQYCGGAAPDDEILEQYNIAKPFQDTLYLHEGPDQHDDGILLIFNKQGKAKLSVAGNGTYFAFRYPKMDLSTLVANPQVPGDPLCEFNFKNREMIPLNFDVETTSITDTIRFSCNPCNMEIPMMPPMDMDPPKLEEEDK